MDPAKLTARQRLLGSAGSSTNAIPISRQISSKISLPISQSPCEREPALQRTIIREMQVRVPNRAEKRFSVLRFHASDRVNLSSPTGSSLPPEVFMQRENNLKQYKGGLNIIDAPTKGAGSEFGREAREEARLRKYGVTRKGYRPEDQPWLFTIGKGRTARKFRGVREGGVSDNVQYFVFCQCKEGNFDAYPVCEWYKMKPEVNYRFLREEEAEAEYSRLHKTFNLFNVMLKRKLGHDDAEGGFELEAKDEKDVLR
ncbi:unnamed protein product [Protopolystoma xenopodis]|uniref:Transcription initiation factor IIF subunit alpha n=1 Tax=Protopolystoma xenopodis TaxID=117903 RepID=A0A448X8F6_9PLAT|nr:unnamed protein product [Protopolystoma xenopodis]